MCSCRGRALGLRVLLLGSLFSHEHWLLFVRWKEAAMGEQLLEAFPMSISDGSRREVCELIHVNGTRHGSLVSNTHNISFFAPAGLFRASFSIRRVEERRRRVARCYVFHREKRKLRVEVTSALLGSLSPLISSPSLSSPLDAAVPSSPSSTTSRPLCTTTSSDRARGHCHTHNSHCSPALRAPPMAQTKGEMATQLPQSLPSFAQTFGSPSLTRHSEVNNALPPIQHRPTPLDRSRSAHTSPQPSSVGEHKQTARKRLHSESTLADSADVSGPEGVSPDSSSRRSPRAPVRVKQETDTDNLLSLKLPAAPVVAQTKTGAPPQTPSSSSSPNPNPSKKRRMTISGINTDVRRPSVDSGISPVVMGLTIPPDDPIALEQVRSMVNLKHQQQALIESRRGSLASIMPPTAPPDVNIVNSLSATDERASTSKTAPSIRTSRRSPNLAPNAGPRGSIVASSSAAPPQQQQPQSSMPIERLPTPPPPTATLTARRHPAQPRPATDSPPTHTHVHPSLPNPNNSNIQPPAHALPPPPISFARRRASRQVGGTKGKPADILISPRTLQEGGLQPIIQSAPPIPRGGQSQSLSGRFPLMALPSVPPVMGTGQPPKRISTAQVPPTPTRLSIARQAAGAPTGRSPPAASVPIASTLVPPTPASLHHPGYAGEKSAFLAPFEMFYDALNDSKQLKTWLSEQLHKSNALMATLQRQQEQMEETVHHLVDKKVAAMRGEVYDLKMRVDELEMQLRHARAQGHSPSTGGAKGKGAVNGYGNVSATSPLVGPTDTYHFPPIESLRRPDQPRRVSSPSSEHHPASQTSSPVPFDVGKRLSVSAIRHDPRPEHHQHVPRGSISQLAQTFPSPHSSHHPHAGASNSTSNSTSSNSKPGWSPRAPKMSLPTSSTRQSLSSATTHAPISERERERPSMQRRSSIDRAGRMPHPPEKRRASRSPDADEEGRLAPPPRLAGEQRRASVGAVQHDRVRSPMDTS
ncbi:hypothetical protein BDW22DRAFT_1348094 [Trametopsis cervina]|nr:hypothetical protein BDW22DRAFT_1348094 [Trametopsis cervina]